MVEAGGRLRCQIKGQQLKDLDLFSKSDPICLVEEYKNNQWEVVAQTEKLDDNLNPEFQTQPEFNYTQVSQRMKFTMWDHDSATEYELIGLANCTVDELLQAQASGQPWTAKLAHPDKPND